MDRDETQFKKLCNRIPFDENVFESQDAYERAIDELLEDSKFVALSKIYPFEDYSDMELPAKYKNWQLRASIELYNLADKSGIVSYSENGLSWTKSTDGLSDTLMNELVSNVGIPKKKNKGSEE
jgi:hypothetical protein